MIHLFLVLLPFLIFVIAATIWLRKKEKKEWNNGVCAESGKPWILFDETRHIGRGYTDNCGNYIWISYKVDKRG